jgi:hypothetical protein
MAVTDVLTNVNEAASDIQNFANALADKIRAGGDFAVRTGNATTGAAVGAKAGSAAPTTPLLDQPAVRYGGLALLAYLLLRR